MKDRCSGCQYLRVCTYNRAYGDLCSSCQERVDRNSSFVEYVSNPGNSWIDSEKIPDLNPMKMIQGLSLI